jgi:hypothetical protein
MLSQPSLLIIDHGHFQYNSVALGLVLWALGFLSNDRDLLGSIAFTLALNYKQMSLYFAPAFFFYLLGKSYKNSSSWYFLDDCTSVNRSFHHPLSSAVIFAKIQRAEGTFKVIKIGIVVIGTMVACWLPFYLERGPDGILDVSLPIFAERPTLISAVVFRATSFHICFCPNTVGAISHLPSSSWSLRRQSSELLVLRLSGDQV